MSLAQIQLRLNGLLEEGESILRTQHYIEDVISQPFVKEDVFYEWKAGALSFLSSVFGEKHPHFIAFNKDVEHAYASDAQKGQGILKAAKKDIENGFLQNIEDIVAADIFTDFIEIAEHLLEKGYKDPAASLTGAVLEDGLRKIAKKSSIPVQAKEDISSLNQKIADNGVYNRLQQKQIQVWKEIRDNADHGKFEEYKIQNVKEMLDGVRSFLSTSM